MARACDSDCQALAINWQETRFNKLPIFRQHQESCVGEAGLSQATVNVSFGDRIGYQGDWLWPVRCQR